MNMEEDYDDFWAQRTEDKRKRARVKSWWVRIEEARARVSEALPGGQFTEEDIALAGDWVTCACGERDDILLNGENDPAPEDRELYKLGMEFSEAVRDHMVDEAQATLVLIQERAAKLLEAGLGRKAGEEGKEGG